MLYLYRSNAIFLQHFRRYFYGSYFLCGTESVNRKGKREKNQYLDVCACCLIYFEIYFLIRTCGRKRYFCKRIEEVLNSLSFWNSSIMAGCFSFLLYRSKQSGIILYRQWSSTIFERKEKDKQNEFTHNGTYYKIIYRPRTFG